jgi:hypothetical protein
LQKLNKEDKDYIINFVIDEMEDKSEYYKTTSISSIVFSYNIKRGKAKEKINLNNTNFIYQDYQHHKLPITTNPLEYGKLIQVIDNKYIIQINETNIAIITKENDVNKVKFFRKGELVFEYKDKIVDSNTFIRSINNKQFTFVNNELVFIDY